MAKYTKKWDKDFTKRYSNAIAELNLLESEYKEMCESNPDEWALSFMSPKEDEIRMGEYQSYGIYDFSDKEETPYVDFTFNFKLARVNFTISDLKDLIAFRNELMGVIDTFKRPLENPKVKYSSEDDCEDEDTEEQEWTIKAEQPLTQSWTYTVTAKSACQAIKMLEEDPDQDGIVNNDDNEYYDYGETEYESI
jgi:hypothetical protein